MPTAFTAGRVSAAVTFSGRGKRRARTVGGGASESKAAAAGCPVDEALSTARFSVVSYNLLAQSRIRGPKYPYCGRGVIKWQLRRKLLLDEIGSLRADILCLQEVDNYESFWRPELRAVRSQKGPIY